MTLHDKLSKSAEKKIHVVVAVRNRKAITKAFIEKLLSQTYKNIHLLLIDDGSTDGTREIVEEAAIDKTIVSGDGTLWWGGAMHQAFLWFCSNDIEENDFVLIMNDDVIIDDDFIEQGVNRLSSEQKSLLTGIGFGLQNRIQMDGPVCYNFLNGKSYVTKNDEEANCASTHAIFFRVKDFIAIGGFHPILLPHYGSDYEYTIRAWRKGYRIISDSNIKYFFNEETTGNMSYLDIEPSSFFKKLISKKSVFNPIYKLNFIILACPIWYIPINMFIQIIRYMRNLFLYITRFLSPKKER